MHLPSVTVTWNREFQKEAGVCHCLGRSWLGVGKSLDLQFCQLVKTQNSEGKRCPTHPAPWDPDPAGVTQSNSHCGLNFFFLFYKVSFRGEFQGGGQQLWGTAEKKPRGWWWLFEGRISKSSRASK